MSSSLELVEDITWTCSDGVKIAGKRWTTNNNNNGNDDKKLRILALHGWMDNCASFDALSRGLMGKLGVLSASPSLSESSNANAIDFGVDFVAIDLPGHGHSSHKSLDGPTSVQAEYCYYVFEMLRLLQWKPEDVTIIGHSMGASIALMYAAAFPLKRMCMLDSLGPMTKPAETISKNLRTGIKTRAQGKIPGSVYPNFHTAVEARCRTPGLLFPGKQYISEATAKALVERGSIQLVAESVQEPGENGQTTDANGNNTGNGRIRFRHDQRLNWPSMLYLSVAQVEQMYRDVANQKTSTCLLTAIDGMPFPPDKIARIKTHLKPDLYRSLPGSHHFHSDPDGVEGVVDAIFSWLTL